MPNSRNEGFVAINRLTGAYLEEGTQLRKLVAHVKGKAPVGTWVDIIGHVNGGGRDKVMGFMVERKQKGR